MLTRSPNWKRVFYYPKLSENHFINPNNNNESDLEVAQK